MTGALSALAPVFLTIALGYGLRAGGVLGDAFWRSAEWLVFWVLFPSMLFAKIAGVAVDWSGMGPLALVIVLGIAGTGLMTAPLRPFGGFSGEAFTAVFQGATRPNSYVGIAAALAFFGDDAIAATAVALAVIAPLINIMGVMAHVLWVPAADGTAGRTARAAFLSLFRNPIVIATVGGALWNMAGLPLPPLIGPTLEILGSASLPLALMAVGAGLIPAALRARGGAIAYACVLKLALMPALTLAAAAALGVTGIERAVALMFTAIPTSSTAYVISRQMGSDAELMAGIVTGTTLAAAITLPLTLAWLL